MKYAFLCALLASASVGLSACSKTESPDTVKSNVAKAMGEAAENNAKADEKMKQTEAEAKQDLAREKSAAEDRAADKSVGAVADAAVTETEGATKVALAKCEALEGDAQKQCKDKANVHLQTVKDRAKAAKSP